ncbi:apoptosis antagonizing transcription factor-domain-containing protein [Triangularia verruculosa]|uniref:Protein BFR2 n=1 Tax=Triangularia verruculosa TaxID=2587418 RepID=A0AAN6XHQ2_9PEZI|nr:apoptosis antagonizing transcription factor-domain-containing protein [Triangularia verruculosa]
MAPVAKKVKPSKRFAQFEEKLAKDFDIENEPQSADEGSESEESENELAGTEHYVTVGKSKLREKEGINLGPEYRGARVSRAALEQSSDEEDGSEEDEDDEEEEFDDPSMADLERDQNFDEDFEIDSDNALGESDEERFKDYVFRASAKPRTEKVKANGKAKEEPKANGRIAKRPTAADFMTSSGEEDEEEDDDDEDEDEDEEDYDSVADGMEMFDMEAGEDSEEGSEDDSEADYEGAMLSGEDEEGSEDGEEGSEDDEEEDGEDEDDEQDDFRKALKNDKKFNKDSDSFKLREALKEDKKSIVSAMSQAAKADAEKGIAVRVQRRAFDSILNLRIRLQKALVATNTFNQVENNQDISNKPYQAAEEAAVKLWNTIDSVRHSFLPEQARAKVGEKRKRETIDVDTSSQEIWENMLATEEVALTHRRKVLDKWSERVKKNTTTGATTRNLVKNESQSLLSALDSQLVSSDRLVKRARTPRSCAPAQAAKKVEEDAQIYDDADFYQLLLKELVDQRSADTGAPGESVTTVRWAALKEAKVRKQVDRKASKGRKLRYTVHEKLQNFMAPEDRRGWEEPAIDRLFGALFGQKLALKEEDDNEEEEDEEMGGVSLEEAGLKLFRS